MPEEMALEILSRLPPKSLMRFKCVHESWSILINNPSFVAKHLSDGLHKNVYTRLLLKRLIVKDTNSDEKETVFSLLNIYNYNNDDGEHDINYVLEDMTKGHFMGLKFLESACIIGHCDGIICLADPSFVIVLLNPAIMEFKLITGEKNVPDKRLNLGFGYDAKSKNYKVVDVFPLGVETYGDENIIYNPPTIKVYISGTDSWRQIMTDSLESETTNFCLDSFEIYFKGFCYWTGREQLKEYKSDEYDYDGGNIRQIIISFDMGDEVFHNILIPHCLYDDSCFSWYDIHLMVWNESIALLSLDGDTAQAETLGMWVMVEFGGVECSWIKQFTFGKAMGIVTPLQFLNSDEILMFSEEGRMVSYNLDTEKLNHLPIHSLGSEDFLAVAYVTSIVGITGSTVPQSGGNSTNIISESVSHPKD